MRDGGPWTRLIWLRIRERWRALVNTVTNLWLPQSAGNFLTSWEPVSVSKMTLLHAVRKIQLYSRDRKTSLQTWESQPPWGITWYFPFLAAYRYPVFPSHVASSHRVIIACACYSWRICCLHHATAIRGNAYTLNYVDIPANRVSN
jgi:hypothetical protein